MIVTSSCQSAAHGAESARKIFKAARVTMVVFVQDTGDVGWASARGAVGMAETLHSCISALRSACSGEKL
jgi:hypothetical protein